MKRRWRCPPEGSPPCAIRLTQVARAVTRNKQAGGSDCIKMGAALTCSDNHVWAATDRGDAKPEQCQGARRQAIISGTNWSSIQLISSRRRNLRFFSRAMASWSGTDCAINAAMALSRSRCSTRSNSSRRVISSRVMQWLPSTVRDAAPGYNRNSPAPSRYFRAPRDMQAAATQPRGTPDNASSLQQCVSTEMTHFVRDKRHWLWSTRYPAGRPRHESCCGGPAEQRKECAYEQVRICQFRSHLGAGCPTCRP